MCYARCACLYFSGIPGNQDSHRPGLEGSVSKESDRDRDRVERSDQDEQHDEVGHTLGLRHNFIAQEDGWAREGPLRTVELTFNSGARLGIN